MSTTAAVGRAPLGAGTGTGSSCTSCTAASTTTAGDGDGSAGDGDGSAAATGATGAACPFASIGALIPRVVVDAAHDWK